MKLTVNLGDELRNATITHSTVIPVTRDFDIRSVIGEAILNEDYTIAEIKLIEGVELPVNMEKYYEVAISGKIKRRVGCRIESFQIQSASIAFKNPATNK